MKSNSSLCLKLIFVLFFQQKAMTDILTQNRSPNFTIPSSYKEFLKLYMASITQKSYKRLPLICPYPATRL